MFKQRDGGDATSARGHRAAHDRGPVTIAVPTSGGWTFEAQLEDDEFHMLWLVQRHRRTGERSWGSCCRPLSRTPAGLWTPRGEQVLLDARGFGSGRIQ
jgi:hypothetical protein